MCLGENGPVRLFFMPTSATLKSVRCTVNKRGQNKSICRIEKQQFGLLTHDLKKKKNRSKLRPLIFPDCMCLSACVYILYLYIWIL